MDIGKDSLGAGKILLKLRNDGMGIRNTLLDVGNDGLGGHDTATNVGNGHIGVDYKFGLEGRTFSTFRNSHAWAVELTLKTQRILSRSDRQAMNVSLSLLAWKTREAALRPLRSMIFLLISATVLRSNREHTVNEGVQTITSMACGILKLTSSVG